MLVLCSVVAVSDPGAPALRFSQIKYRPMEVAVVPIRRRGSDLRAARLRLRAWTISSYLSFASGVPPVLAMFDTDRENPAKAAFPFQLRQIFYPPGTQ